MGEIRNCTREDIPAVAALFHKTFRKSKGKPPRSLEACLADVYLDHPWFDPEVAARVHVNGAGKVTGFIGVFPGRFKLHNRSYRAAIAGSLMAEDPDSDPLAGAKLVRSVIKGPQDVTISETAILLSQGLWERLGATVLPPYSLDWVHVLRPGAAALSLLAERAPAASLLAPFGPVGDRIAARWINGSAALLPPAARLTRQADPSSDEFAAALGKLSALTALHPDWDTRDIRWFVAQAERKERYGAVHCAILRDARGELAGCYIYHGRSGGIGRVLQVLAQPSSADGVVDAMLRDAGEARLAALRGRGTPQIANALLKRNCVYVHNASTVIHTSDPELLAAAERGEATITGLAGESWARLIGGIFS